MLLEGEAERAGVGRDGSQGKHGEIHSREEETRGDSGLRQTALGAEMP